MHFCMGSVHSIALVKDAARCPMEMKAPACHKVKKASCCEDEQVTFEGKDFKSQESVSLAVAAEHSAIVLPLILEINNCDSPTSALVSANLYKPPVLPQDIPVLIQSFLI
jgi:hypothetical protein